MTGDQVLVFIMRMNIRIISRVLLLWKHFSPDFCYAIIKPMTWTDFPTEYKVTQLEYLGLTSQARMSELCGLLWENVNFNKGFLTISNSLSGPTKDLESRIIHMNEHLFEILQKQRSISNGSKYVFPKNNGNMRGRNFTKRFRSTLKRAGINKHLVVHDLRHTFATQYAKTGSIYTLKEFMWHSDIKTTER